MIRSTVVQVLVLCAVLATSAARSEPQAAVRQTGGGTSTAVGYGQARHLQLLASAPDVAPHVLALALRAGACAVQSGVVPALTKLAVIDYSRPSTERRFWLFDLTSDALMFDEHVAHGRGTGENMARDFSNVEGSHQSSLGLFLTADTYVGGNGYSLNLDGLEPGINDRARERRIVMHGAAYVDPVGSLRQGRLGRSHGCPALRLAVATRVIDTLKGGHLLFAYYPDKAWLSNSQFLNCDGRGLNAAIVEKRSPAFAGANAARSTLPRPAIEGPGITSQLLVGGTGIEPVTPTMSR